MSLAYSELLENSEFFDGSDVNISKIQNASIDDILEFCAHSIELSSVDDISISRSLLSHTASLSLSGSAYGCAELGCRLDRAKELAQFSAFYSDRIYINNFLSEHLTHLDHKILPDESLLKLHFANDLTVLSYLKPFIDTDRIIPITAPQYCKDCFARSIFGSKADDRLDQAYDKLIHQYQNEARVYLTKEDDYYYIYAEAPEHLLEHGFSGFRMDKLPFDVSAMPALLKSIDSGIEIELSRDIKQQFEIDEHLANSVFNAIVYELAMTHSLQTSYLSDSELEINFIQNLTNDTDLERRNHILEKYLTCFVPFIKNIEPSSVLKLREDENESFVLFRQRLTEAIKEFQSQEDNINEKNANQIYHDILAPQLAKLELEIGSARRILSKDTTKKLVGVSAAISVGMYNGLSLGNAMTIAATLGITNVVTDLIFEALKIGDSKEKIRNSDMYFLWKVKKESEAQNKITHNH